MSTARNNSKRDEYQEYLHRLRQEEDRRRKEWPDGEPPEWKKEQWYRHVENGATKWVYSAQCLQQDFYAEVTDTGKQFRWEVGFDSVADAGYTRSLSTAMHKAVDVYEDLTGPKQKETEGT